MTPIETCKHGHPKTPENTYYGTQGYPLCRECRIIRDRKRHDRKRAEEGRKPRKTATDTHCANGHPWTDENLRYRDSDGGRYCATCSRESAARSNRRKGHKPQKRATDTHCANGHPWTPETRGTTAEGRPRCRECDRARNNKRYLQTTHCPQGHEYTAENTELNARGRRMCLTCKQEREATRTVTRTVTRKRPAAQRKPRPAPKPKTHCINGHEIAEVGRHPSGGCKQCVRDRAAAKRAERRKSRPVVARPRVQAGCCPEGHRMTKANTHVDPMWGVQCVTCLDKATGRDRRELSQAGRGGHIGAEKIGVQTVMDPAHRAAVRDLLERRGLLAEFGEMLGVTDGPVLVVAA